MKKLFITAIAACGLFMAEAQLKILVLSPTQIIKQDFALSSVELSYSRPGMKGRTIYGELVPYGKVWRTGANQATTLTFGEDVMIGGTKVKAGKYGLLTIPERKEWTIIITKQLDVTSPAAYKEDMDVVRVIASTEKMSDKMETFTIEFANVTPNKCDLEMKWENTAVKLPISVDVETKVMAQIDQLMNKENRPYFNAAMYYIDNG